MIQPTRRNITIVSAVVVVVLVAAAAVVHRRLSSGARIEDLREELLRTRATADSCRNSLEREEGRFRAFEERVDSLRGRVEGFEEVHPETGGRGVPADSYETYMEAYQRYNRTIPAWEERADTLEARWERCRELVRRHNVLADSLRALLLEHGLVGDTVRR